MDEGWGADGAQPRGGRGGWLARASAALGRALGWRRPVPARLDPAEDRRPRSERTRPIDADDLIEARVVPSRRAKTHQPPPPPRARGSGSRGAIAVAADDGYDPLDTLITSLLSGEQLELPPPPAIDDLAWLARLDPLIEYELMARGSTAVSFQSTAAQLGELVALDDTDFNAAVRVVSRDPAVAAAILSCANTVELKRGSAVSDIRTAVARLGLAETRRIGIATAARALHDADAKALAPHHRARAHRDLHRAMTCAFASNALAAREGIVGGEDAFVAGMFVDLGRPLVHRAVVALERRDRVDPVPASALDLIIERTHGAVGAESLAAWGLPRRLAELARHHLSPAPPPAVDGPDLHRLALVSSLVLLRVGAPVPLGAARRAAAALGFDRDRLRALALDVAEMAAKVTELFAVRDADTTWAPH